MKKVNLTALLLFFVLLVSAAEMPDAYYSAANGKSDSILKSSLSQIIRKHTVLSYGSGSNSSWYCFYYADRDPVTGLCMDMYSDDWRSFSSPGSVVSGCNIEHSFAKSWWGGSKNDAYQDCYHLNPSNSTANSSRSNYPLGVPTQELKSNTGSLRVGKATYNGQTFFVFEPKDEYKGDFARAYLYMATCYGDELTWRKDNKDVGSYYTMRNPTDKDAYLEFLDWEIEILLKWHRQDPVSIKEINRASAVNDFQKNRNPFIDYPCLAEYIWGNKKGEAVDISRLMSSGNSLYLNSQDKSGCSCVSTNIANVNLDFGVVCVSTGTQISLSQLPENSEVFIFDVMGRLCGDRKNCQTEELFEVSTKGVYLIQVAHQGKFNTLKTLIF